LRNPPGRTTEDYAVVYLGSSIFKIARLVVIAVFSVHFFACSFFKIKQISAPSQEDVVAFYTSRGIDENVSVSVLMLCARKAQTNMPLTRSVHCRISPTNM
jgi:hypothetical protein